MQLIFNSNNISLHQFICIYDIRGSNRGPETRYPEVFLLLQSLQANSTKGSQATFLPDPFQLHRLFPIVSIDTT